MSTAQPAYQSPVLVAPNIFMVQIPIPIPLKYVNCYLCQAPSGWTLIDTGFHDSLAEDAWPRAFDELGIRPQDIVQILVTHYHPDHLGAAGWLQQMTGAPVLLPETEMAQIERFWGTGMEAMANGLRDLFSENGMPNEMAQAIANHHVRQHERVQPLPTLTPVPIGSHLRMGTLSYEVLWTPGHSDGLAVFWNEATSMLLANDMLLNKITPNVSLWPYGRSNPLQDYIESLARVEQLNARVALPGHRSLITEVGARIREVRQHHTERLNRMETACAGGRGATAWDVCTEVFSPDTLTIHQVRFAMSETLAHLVYMEKQGRLLKKRNRFVQA